MSSGRDFGEMTVVTATDGRQANLPAKFVKNYTQEIIDSLVMQAHRGSVMDRATCQAVGVSAVVDP
ncbi:MULTISPECIES: hypothetical protein [Mycolicibacterium]|uniref:hypothetical protein n=1 Tax=Mycolicibacterium TaxID=1866885 RepID=UPI0026055E51|nr:hypothetical protein [Mycolicibacterium fortuitum]